MLRMWKVLFLTCSVLLLQDCVSKKRQSQKKAPKAQEETVVTDEGGDAAGGDEELEIVSEKPELVNPDAISDDMPASEKRSVVLRYGAIAGTVIAALGVTWLVKNRRSLRKGLGDAVGSIADVSLPGGAFYKRLIAKVFPDVDLKKAVAGDKDEYGELTRFAQTHADQAGERPVTKGILDELTNEVQYKADVKPNVKDKAIKALENALMSSSENGKFDEDAVRKSLKPVMADNEKLNAVVAKYESAFAKAKRKGLSLIYEQRSLSKHNTKVVLEDIFTNLQSAKREAWLTAGIDADLIPDAFVKEITASGTSAKDIATKLMNYRENLTKKGMSMEALLGIGGDTKVASNKKLYQAAVNNDASPDEIDSYLAEIKQALSVFDDAENSDADAGEGAKKALEKGLGMRKEDIQDLFASSGEKNDEKKALIQRYFGPDTDPKIKKKLTGLYSAGDNVKEYLGEYDSLHRAIELRKASSSAAQTEKAGTTHLARLASTALTAALKVEMKNGRGIPEGEYAAVEMLALMQTTSDSRPSQNFLQTFFEKMKNFINRD